MKHKRLWAQLWLIVSLTASGCCTAKMATAPLPEGEYCVVWDNPPSCVCVDDLGKATRKMAIDQCKGRVAVMPELFERLIQK